MKPCPCCALLDGEHRRGRVADRAPELRAQILARRLCKRKRGGRRQEDFLLLREEMSGRGESAARARSHTYLVLLRGAVVWREELCKALLRAIVLDRLDVAVQLLRLRAHARTETQRLAQSETAHTHTLIRARTPARSGGCPRRPRPPRSTGRGALCGRSPDRARPACSVLTGARWLAAKPQPPRHARAGASLCLSASLCLCPFLSASPEP